MKLPPGPRAPALAQTAAWWLRPLDMLDACARRYGDVFTIRFAGFGAVVMVSAPEHVRQVFTGDPDALRAGEANVALLPIVGRHSVLLLDGPEHIRQRRLMMPPFLGERMAVYAEIMRESTLAALRGWPVGEPFSLHRSMQTITLDVILHAIFGLDEGPGLRGFGVKLLDLFHEPPSLLLLLPALRIDAPFSPYRRFLRARGEVDRAIYGIIDERRRAGDLAARKDILSLLLSARDEAGQAMSDEEVHDELMTMVAAGHETSATALAWTFERVLADPGVHARAVAEVEAATAAGPLDAAAIPKLEYVDAIVKETLRLRPIIPIVGRVLHEPLQLGEHTLPPGCAVAPCIYLAHRRAESWPEPERFWPERWLGGSDGPAGRRARSRPGQGQGGGRMDPYAWLPFGGGGRRCIGMGFAMYEMKMIVATVLSHTKLRPASPVPERAVRRAVTLYPSAGARVVMTEPAAVPMSRASG